MHTNLHLTGFRRSPTAAVVPKLPMQPDPMAPHRDDPPTQTGSLCPRAHNAPRPDGTSPSCVKRKGLLPFNAGAASPCSFLQQQCPWLTMRTDLHLTGFSCSPTAAVCPAAPNATGLDGTSPRRSSSLQQQQIVPTACVLPGTPAPHCGDPGNGFSLDSSSFFSIRLRRTIYCSGFGGARPFSQTTLRAPSFLPRQSGTVTT